MHSNTFKASRIIMDLSQRELADRMGVSLNTIQKIEASNSDVKLTNEHSIRFIARRDFNLDLSSDDVSCVRCDLRPVSRDHLCAVCIDQILFDFLKLNKEGLLK